MPATARPDAPALDPAAVRAAKARLRARISADRLVPEPAAATKRRTALALEVCADHDTVALYASADGEPDTWGLLEALHQQGRAVLLPVLGPRPDGSVRRQPDWARYEGRTQLRAGYAGILEPTGAALGADGLALASLVLCAGLAATERGDRLGTGGGWYDRALPAAQGALVGVLLREAEVVDDLPVEPFDRPVHLIITERRVHRVTGRGAGRVE